jgi:predicted metalloenzyme YecM
METIVSFRKKAQPLIGACDEFARAHSLPGNAVLDHFCFKCASKEEFELMRAMLEPEADFLYQSYISGRRIAIIRLKEALQSVLGPVDVLELSDQKPSGSQKSGFDRVEILPVGLSYEELTAKLEKEGVTLRKIERPHHTTLEADLSEGYEVKLTREPLLEKIKRDEMQ